jgi:PAS domain S-box-containing protein
MELRRRMERYQILVETMNDGLGVLDENGMVTFVNDRVCEMIGFSKEEIIGRLVTDFIDDGYRQIFMTHFEEHKEGVIRSFELTCVKKSGEKIHFIVSPKPILDDEGNFRGAFAVMTDITGRRKYEETIEKLNEELELRVEERTRQLKAVVEELEAEIMERKRIEIALKESEAKFRAITRTATDAIVLMDDEGKISYWNPAAEKILGIRDMRLWVKIFISFLHPGNTIRLFYRASIFSESQGRAR